MKLNIVYFKNTYLYYIEPSFKVYSLVRNAMNDIFDLFHEKILLKNVHKNLRKYLR